VVVGALFLCAAALLAWDLRTPAQVPWLPAAVGDHAAERAGEEPVASYAMLVSIWNARRPTVALDSTKSGRSVTIWARASSGSGAETASRSATGGRRRVRSDTGGSSQKFSRT